MRRIERPTVGVTWAMLVLSGVVMATGCSTLPDEGRTAAPGSDSAQNHRALSDQSKQPANVGSREPQSTMEPEWAGTYRIISLNAETSIRLHAQNGLTYSYSTHVLGSAPVRARALIKLTTADRIEVEYTEPLGPYRDQSVAYFYVRWGDRRFLVAEARMIEFCFWANDRSNWASVSPPFPMRQVLGRHHLDTDEHIPVPLVPHDYDAYVLRQPVIAAVRSFSSAIAEESTPGYPLTRTTVIANAGRDQGLVEGMSLFLVDIDGYGKGRVAEVEDSTCRVTFIHPTLTNTPSTQLERDAYLSSTAPLGAWNH